MKWEISLIPKDAENVPSITIDAENWMEAFHSGFASLSGKNEKAKIISCLVKEDFSVWITDITTKQRFVVKPLGESLNLPPIPEPQGESFLESISTTGSPPIPDKVYEHSQQEVKGEFIPIPIDVRQDLPPTPPPVEEKPIQVAVKPPEPAAFQVQSQSVQNPVMPSPGAIEHHAPRPHERAKELDANQALSEVFEELQDLFLVQTQEEAAQYVLDLAMKKIPVQAGTVFLADINTRDLTFTAVKGPVAEKLKGQKLNLKKGIIGFAAREGATIAISDVSKDPRFCSDFDQHGEFVTKSVLCAPAQYEGRTFGAIELVNRISGDMFTQSEINIVSYLASQLAEFIATSLPSGEPDSFEEEDKQQKKTSKPPQIKKNKTKKYR